MATKKPQPPAPITMQTGKDEYPDFENRVFCQDCTKRYGCKNALPVRILQNCNLFLGKT